MGPEQGALIASQIARTAKERRGQKTGEVENGPSHPGPGTLARGAKGVKVVRLARIECSICVPLR